MTTSIDLDEVLRLTDEGATLVEVLPEAEYRQIHPQGAINLPLKKLNAESSKQLDRSAPVIVYCNDFL